MVACTDPNPLTNFYGSGLAEDECLPSNPTKMLIIVHGVGEHRGRYRSAVDRIVESDIACVTYDQRGHGQSPGSRTDIEDFSCFAEDLSKIVQGVAGRYPGLPIFLWGHSLGSIVVLDFATRIPMYISGAITTGCPLRAVPTPLAAISSAGRWIAGLLPTIRLTSQLNPEDLSHEKSVQDNYRNDALVTPSITLCLGFEMAKTIRTIRKQAHNVEFPWLAVHGSEDAIAPPEGSVMLIELLGARDKQLVLLDGLRHEVHNESPIERERFLSLLTNWIARH